MSINWWMDKEDVVYIYNRILLGNEKEWNHAICRNIDGTGRYYAEWISQRRTDIICFPSYVDIEKLNRRPRGKGRVKKKKVTNREGGRQTIREQTEGGWGLGKRAKWVMGMEGGTCWDEHWVLYGSDEPWESTQNQEHSLHTDRKSVV